MKDIYKVQTRPVALEANMVIDEAISESPC